MFSSPPWHPTIPRLIDQRGIALFSEMERKERAIERERTYAQPASSSLKEETASSSFSSHARLTLLSGRASDGDGDHFELAPASQPVSPSIEGT